jgi:hypothetical protein
MNAASIASMTAGSVIGLGTTPSPFVASTCPLAGDGR